MWHSLALEVLKERLHRGVIAEAAVLLIEAKVCGVEVHLERRRFAAELAQYVVGTPDMRF